MLDKILDMGMNIGKAVVKQIAMNKLSDAMSGKPIIKLPRVPIKPSKPRVNHKHS
jgi:hypothetical protein